MRQRKPIKSPLLALGLALVPAAAIAETMVTPPPIGTCYEMIPGDANTLPGRPMLFNKCTGETYVLARITPKSKAANGGSYRWLPIGIGDGPDFKSKPATVPPAGHKCFSFDGRQFCP